MLEEPLEEERDEYEVFDALKLLPLEELLLLLDGEELLRLLKLRLLFADASSAQKSSPAKSARRVMMLTHEKNFFM